jgi:hypothetical protein
MSIGSLSWILPTRARPPRKKCSIVISKHYLGFGKVRLSVSLYNESLLGFLSSFIDFSNGGPYNEEVVVNLEIFDKEVGFFLDNSIV